MATKPAHLDKVFWPGEGYTKGDVIAYYEKIAPTLLRYVKGRPENMHRHPDGIRGEHFYQKDTANLTLPKGTRTVRIKATSTGETLRYIVCDSKATLRYLAELGCIELNPWASRVGHLGKPDYLAFDLDPSPSNSFADVIRVARALHGLLDELGVASYPKTSGKRGIHVCIPLGAKYSYDAARDFAEAVTEALAAELPKFASTAQRKAARRGKIYLDTGRNGEGQTLAAPYSLRPAKGATVSTPLEWSEVKAGLNPARFTIKTIFARIAKKGDLWRPVLGRGANLERARKRLAKRAGLAAQKKNARS